MNKKSILYEYHIVKSIPDVFKHLTTEEYEIKIYHEKKFSEIEFQEMVKTEYYRGQIGIHSLSLLASDLCQRKEFYTESLAKQLLEKEKLFDEIEENVASIALFNF